MKHKLLAAMTCVAVLGMVYSGGVFALSDDSTNDLSEDPNYITPCPDYIEPGETPTPFPTPTPTEEPTPTPTPTPTDTYTEPDPCA